MSSHARSSREEDRRISIQTLVIASIASAAAAIVTSQFWVRGTPIAAALTPVIVALVSEMLHRPTQKIAARLTTETAALKQETDVLPEAAGAGPPPPRQEYAPRPARDELAREEAPEYRVYRSSPEYRVYDPERRRIPWKPVLLTAALAFAVAAAALTLPELIAGESVGGGDRNFTLFGGDSGKKKKEPEQKTQPTEPQETQPGEEATQPEETVPKLQPTPEQTETEPQTTTEPGTTGGSQAPVP